MVDPEKNIIPLLGVLVIEVDEKVQAMLPGLRHSCGLVIAAESSDAPYSGDPVAIQIERDGSLMCVTLELE